jgi:hypothetical protein
MKLPKTTILYSARTCVPIKRKRRSFCIRTAFPSVVAFPIHSESLSMTYMTSILGRIKLISRSHELGRQVNKKVITRRMTSGNKPGFFASVDCGAL